MALADYTRRLEETRAQLREAQVDGLLVASQYNRRYLTGFSAEDGDITESSGLALLTQQALYLITGTFSLISLEHEITPSGAQVLLTDAQPAWQVVAEAAARDGLRRIAFEEDWLSFSRYTRMRTALGVGVELVPGGDLVAPARLRKDAAEVDAMRRAAVCADRAFAQLVKELRVGMTERAIAARLEDLMRSFGASGPSFPTIVAGGPGAALPHAVPTLRETRAGEPLLIDFGCRVDGYCSDLTRTICLGEPDAKLVEVYGVVRAAQDAAEEALQRGVRSGREVDGVAREVIARGGYGKEFMHSLGHGVGVAVHEWPWLATPRYADPEMDAAFAKAEVIPAECVVTIEPGVYIAGWGGVRLEDIGLTHAEGFELLAGRNPERILSVEAPSGS